MRGGFTSETGWREGVGRGSTGTCLAPLKIYSLTRKMIRCIVLAGLLVLFSACAVSENEETAIGRQNAEQINAQLPIVTDPAITSYIQDLGESIAKKTSRSDLDWHFYVINTKQ